MEEKWIFPNKDLLDEPLRLLFQSTKQSIVMGLLENEEIFAKNFFDEIKNLFIVGSAQSGKTNIIKLLLMSFFFKYSPDDLKLIIYTKDILDYQSFNDNPYLLTPVLKDKYILPNVLKWINKEIERREEILQKTQNNIEFPYIIIVIDSLLINDELIAMLTNSLEKNNLKISFMISTLTASAKDLSRQFLNSLPSRIVTRLPNKNESELALGSKGAEGIVVGECYFISPFDKKSKLFIPNLDEVSEECIQGQIKSQRLKTEKDFLSELQI